MFLEALGQLVVARVFGDRLRGCVDRWVASSRYRSAAGGALGRVFDRCSPGRLDVDRAVSCSRSSASSMTTASQHSGEGGAVVASASWGVHDANTAATAAVSRPIRETPSSTIEAATAWPAAVTG